MPLDAVTLEVLWTRVISVVDEAAKAIVRTSFSTLSNEANDFACVLTDAQGRALAQNSGSIPSFIGTLPATVRHFIRELGADAMKPGDVLITNDAGRGTGHMRAVSVLKPIFHRDRLVAFSATTSHMPDIGGRIRAIEAREIFEEGLHIPLARLVRDGRVDDTMVALIRANVRTPDQTMGDIWAQVSANELMERRVRALMDDYGLDNLEALGDELFSRSERAMREAIRAVPDGTYRYGFSTDGTGTPFEFKIALTVRGDEIVADYTGSSPQQPRAINCVMAYTFAMTAYAVRCVLLPGLPNNEGMYRPVKDGENVLSWPSNISSTPVEVAERQSLLFFHYKRLRPGSGGAGRFRGGLGQDILIESRSPRPIVLSVMAERTKFPAPGLAGGAPGGLGDVRINGTRIDNRKQHVLERGDRVLVRTPGGGGYGPRAKRDKTLIARDRALGYVSRGRRAVKEERP